MVVIVLILAALLLPSPLTRFMVGYVAKGRSRAVRTGTYIATAAGLSLFTYLAIEANRVALNWLGAPDEPRNYLKSLRCTIDDSSHLSATAAVSNPTQDALILQPNQLKLHLWHTTASRFTQGLEAPTRITRSSAGVGLPFYIVQPNETVWLELHATSDDAALRFTREMIRSDDQDHFCAFTSPRSPGGNPLAELGAPDVRGELDVHGIERFGR